MLHDCVLSVRVEIFTRPVWIVEGVGVSVT